MKFRFLWSPNFWSLRFCVLVASPSSSTAPTLNRSSHHRSTSSALQFNPSISTLPSNLRSLISSLCRYLIALVIALSSSPICTFSCCFLYFAFQSFTSAMEFHDVGCWISLSLSFYGIAVSSFLWFCFNWLPLVKIYWSFPADWCVRWEFWLIWCN